MAANLNVWGLEIAADMVAEATNIFLLGDWKFWFSRQSGDQISLYFRFKLKE